MRRALCLGIDFYPFGTLSGCVNDAERMNALLAKHADGSPNFDCRKIVAPIGSAPDGITRSKLKQAIELLFKDKADVALLYFSGHGTQNNLGGFLVSQDAKCYDDGVAMVDVLNMANESKAEEVVMILDCCLAGNLGNVPAVDNSKALLSEGVTILTASRGDQCQLRWVVEDFSRPLSPTLWKAAPRISLVPCRRRLSTALRRRLSVPGINARCSSLTFPRWCRSGGASPRSTLLRCGTF